MTDVDVVVAPAADAAAADAEELLARAVGLGLALQPVDLTTDGRTPVVYLVARTDVATAERAVVELRQCAAAAAVYARPRGDAPHEGNAHA